MRTFCHFGAVLILASMTGQAAEFEAADVYVDARNKSAGVRSGFYRSGRYEIREATMADLVGRAYGVESDKVVDGPDWLTSDRFEVVAKAPVDATADALQTMLRGLLARRFGLLARADSREFPTFALTSAKKPLLRSSTGAGDAGCRLTRDSGAFQYDCVQMTMAAFAEAMRTMAGVAAHAGRNPILNETALQGAWDFSFRFGGSGENSVNLFDAVEKERLVTRQNMTMAQFVENLPRIAPRDIPTGDIRSSVVDAAGLAGTWDFTLSFSPMDAAQSADFGGLTIFEAIEKQLGLKLEMRKQSGVVLVIDHVEQRPAEN